MSDIGMLPWLCSIFLLATSSARPPSTQPGYWTLVVSGPVSPNFCPNYIPAGIPFLGQLGSVELEDLFTAVGQHYEDVPQGEYLLEILTARGFQVLLHTATGDRYQRYPPTGYQSGQYLDLRWCGYRYRWGPLALPDMDTDAGTTSTTVIEKEDEVDFDESYEDTNEGNDGRGATNLDAKEIEHSHDVLMDREGEGNFHLFWNFNEEGITFEIVLRAFGYVGLGFSRSGTMAGADIVVAWVDGHGEAHVDDCHADGQGLVLLDTIQHLQVEMGYTNTTHTVVQFYRAWDTCDEEDYKLSTDTKRVLWSYHQDRAQLFQEVSQKGVVSLYLQEPPLDHSPLEPHHVWDVTAGNVTLPGDDHSHYFCRIVKVPDQMLTSKHHMIEIHPLIQPGSEPFVHDITLRECIAPEFIGKSNEELFGHFVGQPGVECYADMPDQWSFCTVIMGWTLGNHGLRMPEHVGCPLGEEFGGATYYKLMVHYDNHGIHQDISDNSGLRIYYSDEPREMDVGVMDSGAGVNIMMMVPPLQNLFKTTGHCTAECTRQTIPKDGIKVWLGLIHTHSAGRKVRVRHVRDGMELPLIFEDNNYDYNFQAFRDPLAGSEIHHEVLVLPGDSLITECEYDTSNRSNPTYGGLTTRSELCISFLLYYPKMPLQSCRSSPTLATFMKSLGIDRLVGESGDLFEKLMSFTFHQRVGPQKQGNITEIVRKLSSEANLDSDDLEHLSDPMFFKDFRRQQDVLVEILSKLIIEEPESLQGTTVGVLLEMTDWSEGGPEMSKVIATDEQRCGCFPRDGVTPLIEYKPLKIPSFTRLEKEKDDVCD